MPKIAFLGGKVMKKAYYVEYYRDFGNTYNLYWAPYDIHVPASFQRITRQKAEKLCRQERQARRDNPDFSGYADTYVWPYGLGYEKAENIYPPECEKSGHYVIISAPGRDRWEEWTIHPGKGGV